MKRCENCGFGNRDESARCVKCNYLLAVEPPEAKSNGYPAVPPPKPALGSQVQKTKAGIKVNAPAWDEFALATEKIAVNCPACSYLMRAGEVICAKCGTNIHTYQAPAPLSEDMSKTVRRVVPEVKRGFRLVAISLDDDTEMHSIPLPQTDNIVLTREMLDSSNNSIARKGHASLTYKDGEWWLENLSSLKTTFVQVNQPVRINAGDTLLIGDRLFRFKSE
jgi:uncharacterized Zn finger protein (UPF0148 family)